jgi:phosphomannomutase/phosphoglucomutase
MYAGLRMIELLSNTNKSVDELLVGINKYYSTPEIKVPASDETKFQVVDKVKEYALSNNYQINDIDGVRVDFPDGWALVRASNTGPNITMRFEGKTIEYRDQLQKEFTAALDDAKDIL